MTGQINTDRPIESKDQDEFNRINFAESLSVQLKNAPKDDSLVAALLGPWGSGKSSILNLVENCIDNELTILRFNPWYFSGAKDLIEQFFREISAQLKSKSDSVLESIGDSLIKYCGLLKPISIIPFLGEGFKEVAGAGEIIGKLLTYQRDSLKNSLYDQKKHIQEELKKVDKKIIVFIDDIDRLAPEEVKELFRLIRLVADFPNMIYFLSFDREKIERYLSIGQDEQFGKEYLEKIYQISYDVPFIHQEDLGKFYTKEIDKHCKSSAHLGQPCFFMS